MYTLSSAYIMLREALGEKKRRDEKKMTKNDGKKSDWEKNTYGLSERLASLGIMGGELRASL